MHRLGRFLIILQAAAFVLAAADDRIVERVDVGRTVPLHGHVHPLALAQNDVGPLDPSAEISYATLLLGPAPSLDAFLAEQQNPASPNYRRWLTPEQFGDRFGLSTNDTNKLVQWLRSQGMQVHDVARGRHWITFSGTAATIGRALHTNFRMYAVGGRTHFANATDPSVPAAFESVVAGIMGLNDFGPTSAMIPSSITPYDPALNSGSSHYLAPNDVATIYNIAPLYAAGIDGTGIKIAVLGQTQVDITDIQTFRKRFGLPPNDPQMVLVGRNPGTTGDLGEADLDIEWAGAVAQNATIIYVYASSVVTSAQYAIDQNLAPIMSFSYETCEIANTPAFRSVAQQANAQGITWLVAAGDEGAGTCDRHAPTPQASRGATVNLFAAFPEVTGVGGTTLNEGTGTYWAASNDANLASALSYIPEKVWNESQQRNSLAASGGGPSAFFAKPVWQTGPGVPDDKARDVPDVSLSAGANHDGYEVVSGNKVIIVGGTSAGTPVFAGIVALVNHQLMSKNAISGPGLGNINPTLYRLAQATSDVFHDVVNGDNKVPCVQESAGCVNGLMGFAAGPGYDLATGLGTVDAFKLAAEWSTGTASTTTVISDSASVDLNGSAQVTATVAGNGKVAPTGAVTFLINDSLLANVSLTTGTAAATGVATTAVPGVRLAPGDQDVTAYYNGDGVFSTSSGKLKIPVNLPASGSVVVPSINPNPVYPTGPTSWPYTVTLVEMAGIATKLTSFTIDGVNNSANIAALGNGSIPAKGSVSATFVGNPATIPTTRTFVFGGVDADGTNWTRQISVPFLAAAGPMFLPSIAIASTPLNMQQNPNANPSCQWSQQLTVQEEAGFAMAITRLVVGLDDFSGQIQQIFGTTRLAPVGTLRGTLCISGSGVAAPVGRTIQLTAASVETGGTTTASVSATLAAPSAAPATFTAAQSAVTMSVANNTQNATATVALSFSGGTPQWTATVLPKRSTTNWLSVTPVNGTGSGKLTLQATATGLSTGAFPATIAIEAPDSLPQYITIPVSLAVGVSATMKISGVSNAASFQPVFAPGELVSVFGTQLTSATATASSIPLPFVLQGASATVNGVSAPIWGVYAGAGQMNLQIPYEVGAGPATLAINNNGQIATYPIHIDVAAPGLFGIWDATGLPATTAKQGQVLVAYITGDGDTNVYVPSGNTASSTTPPSRLPQARLPLSVTVGGVPATVAFEGIPSGFVGVTQINFTVPAVPTGPQPVIVTVGGVSTQAATVNITQ
jgi:uncharacterized protein (TIGR03437 family)